MLKIESRISNMEIVKFYIEKIKILLSSSNENLDLNNNFDF